MAMNNNLRQLPQRGFVLMIALIALAALSLAGLALMRAMSADTAISSNLSFRQSTINTGDVAIDDAITQTTNTLLQPDSNNGGNPLAWTNQGSYYLATMLTNEDPANPCATSATGCIKTNGIPVRLLPENSPTCTASGNGTYTYMLLDTNTGNCAHIMIERLCTAAGQASTSNCIMLSATVNNSDQYAQSHGGDSSEVQLPNNKVAVRVSVRIDGPRGTTTYLQALVGQKVV